MASAEIFMAGYSGLWLVDGQLESPDPGCGVQVRKNHRQTDRTAHKLSATKIKLSHWSTDHSTHL